MIGRLASDVRFNSMRRLFKTTVIGSMALGLLFIRLTYAMRRRKGLRLSSRRENRSSAIFAGRRGDVCMSVAGFSVLRRKRGMKPVVADESRFHEGDWLVISDGAYFPKQ